MKAIALGAIGFVPLAAQAAVVTLVDFGYAPNTSTVSDRFAVPVGTNGAETTYILNGGGRTETVNLNGDGRVVTATITPSAVGTIVASASGYKAHVFTVLDGLDHTQDTECRYTGKDVGECVIAIDTAATGATTFTNAGSGNYFQVVTVSEASAAAPTGGNSGGAAPTTGGNGNNTSSDDKKDKGGAMGLSTGKQLVLTVGGLVLGALTVF
ncbi:hypothetical protein PQX77_012537 [Marasmius sp. AFHP31]|nr:hypothetical protein PQX77_012537 [Marasmius sp. AFHP31]